MLVEISKIKVTERIRKEVTKIEELAKDIKTNGLINPITVMEVCAGEYHLLAGLRRLRAVEHLGKRKIEVNVVEAKDAASALYIEFSENEQRENFTFSEKLNYARLVEEIEKVKSEQRMLEGRALPNPTDCSPEGLVSGETRNIVGEKIGLSGRQYDRAKFIVANGDDKLIEKIDSGEISVFKAYNELKEKIKDEKDSAKVSETKQNPPKKRDNSNEAKIRAMGDKALSYNPIYVKLKEDLEKAKISANIANGKMCDMEEKHRNQLFHLNSINDSLKKQLENMERLLINANDRIKKLEALLKDKLA